MKIKQTQMAGVATPFYYIKVDILDKHGSVASAKLIVDTAASATHIPETLLKKLNPEPAKQCLALMTNGTLARLNRWYLEVVLDDYTYYPENGIATTPNAIGVLGLDVIDNLDILISGNVMIIENNTR